MENTNSFIKTLFLKHATLNTSAQIISVIGPVVCGILAGKEYGSAGLAVTGLFSPLFFLAGFFGMVVANGSSAWASKYLARDDHKSVQVIYTLALLMSVTLSLLLSGGLFFFRGSVLALVVGDGTLLPFASAYYDYSILYVFFTVPIYMPLSWSRLAGKPGISVMLTTVMSGVMVLGGIALVYYTQMGVEGLALSQALATALAFILSQAMLHVGKGGLRFSHPEQVRLHIRQILVLGSPVGLSRLYRFLGIFLLNLILLNAYGSMAVAIFSMLNMLLRFIAAFVTGFSSTIIPIVGVFKEERDTTSIRQMMKAAFLYGNTAVAAIAITLCVFHKQIAAIFGLYDATGAEIFWALVSFSVYIVFYFNVSVLVSYYTAAARVFMANVITFAGDMLFLPFLAFILSAVLDGNLFWVHMPLAGFFTIVLVIVYNMILLNRDRELSHLLLLDRKYERSGKYLSFSVANDIEKASEASAKISDFCESNELSPKQTMLIAMSIEEMLTLIINSGSLRGQTDSLSVRLFLLDGSIILRVRNNGRKFNPIAYYNENITADIERSLDLIGMKYIVEAAEVVYYRETFGVNNLVIII